jgi:hypothetical protein
VKPLLGALRLAQLTTLGAIFASAFSAAAPSAADLAHCAGIADPAARLACYDALSADKAEGKLSAASPPAGSGATAATSTAPAPIAPATAVPSASAASSAPAAPSRVASDPQNFGLTEAQRAPAQLQAGPKSINARIAKINENRWGPASAVLDNGQIWVFIDDAQDAGLKPQDPITIKRGAVGSFLLVTPAHHSYHVRRTQ